MLATRISIMNALVDLADKVGADIEVVRQGVGSDPRIGYGFPYAGTGYGGACFPKHIQALTRTAREYGHDLKIMAGVEFVNDAQKRILVDKVVERFGSSDLTGCTFAVWAWRSSPTRTTCGRHRAE